MFTFIFLLAVIVVPSFFFGKNGQWKNHHGYWGGRTLAVFWGAFFVVLLILISAIWTGIYYHDAVKVNNSYYVVEELEAQRNELSSVLREALTTDEFQLLLEADTPDDISWLHQNAEVTEFMIARADRVVALNNRLFEERNSLLGNARAVCNYLDNPFTLKVPFITPECRLNELNELMRGNDF